MSAGQSELTYRDVRTVLALLDGWGRGRVHYSDGALEVDAWVVEAEDAPAPARRRNLSSPSVGVFRTAGPAAAGGTVEKGATLGHVVTPGASTPVTAGATGQLVEVLVADGDFVEYGQPLAVIAQ